MAFWDCHRQSFHWFSGTLRQSGWRLGLPGGSSSSIPLTVWGTDRGSSPVRSSDSFIVWDASKKTQISCARRLSEACRWRARPRAADVSTRIKRGIVPGSAQNSRGITVPLAVFNPSFTWTSVISGRHGPTLPSLSAASLPRPDDRSDPSSYPGKRKFPGDIVTTSRKSCAAGLGLVRCCLLLIQGLGEKKIAVRQDRQKN